MTPFELKRKQEDKNYDYNPVTLEDGTVLESKIRQDGTKYIVRCSAKKNDVEIGYGVWNTIADRFSVRVEPMSRTNAKILSQAIADRIWQILEMEQV